MQSNETQDINNRLSQSASSGNVSAIPDNSGLAPKKKKPRQANITIVCGMTGVGKSHGIISEIKACLKPDPSKGKLARPAFLLDVNIEPEYKQLFPRTIRVSQIRNVISPECYRIIPNHPDGTSMNASEIRELCVKLCKLQVFNAMAVLDDYDNYASGSSKTRDMTSIFMSNRHRGQDLILVHQDLGMISQIELRNATLFRLHKCNQSVDMIRERFSNYSIIKISELIINEQFDLAEDAYSKGLISEDERNKRRSFFLYINIRTNKIQSNISKTCFIRNCKRYLRLDKKTYSDYVTMELDGVVGHRTRDEIMEDIIEQQFMRYYTVPSAK